MSTCKKICITNRKLAGGHLMERIRSALIAGADLVILREKDMEEAVYKTLAVDVIKLCKSNGKTCVLHSFLGTASQIGHPCIHLTMDALRRLDPAEKSRFKMIGASAHSVREAVEAERLGAFSAKFRQKEPSRRRVLAA